MAQDAKSPVNSGVQSPQQNQHNNNNNNNKNNNYKRMLTKTVICNMKTRK